MPATLEKFNSPSLGHISPDGLVSCIKEFIAANTEKEYQLIIGTDSLPNSRGEVYLVTAIVLHRVGNGGIYFWQRTLTHKLQNLRDRMYAEALASISTAQLLERAVGHNVIDQQNIEIHVDIGEFGPTREMIQELVGMIVAYGYSAKTKPESFAASKVADRHTIPGPKLIQQFI